MANHPRLAGPARDWYTLIMDSERNPLRDLAPPQRFQIMVFLSVMWTTVFCASWSIWTLYDELIAMHLLLAMATLITGGIFRKARQPAPSYRDQPRRDGTARYDDVWGA